MNSGNEGGVSAAPMPQLGTSRTPRADGPRPRRIEPMPSPATGRISPSAAAIARPFLLLLPVLTFLVPSLFVAMTRTPVHTADARMLVGGFDVEAQAMPGFVTASQSLAATYARLVATPAIAAPVAKALNLPEDQVSGHISATAVPESSIIKVEGTASDATKATRYARAAADALLKYASGTTDTNSAADVLRQYSQASAQQAAAQRTLQRYDAAVQASPNPSDSLLAQQAQAQGQADTAKLKSDSLAAKYTALSNAGASSGHVQLVAPATYSGDNRRSMLELAIAGSVGLGLVAGIALATFVVNQQAGGERRADGTARAAS
ncbi:MAG: hypothetical protein JWO68_943 [Actinomycetia bacterium]|nr:hypothetical protein [Actinomycetes bacterium]